MMFEQSDFPVEINQILERVQSVNPLKYGKSRNYTDGAVSRLSPYISRGVIHLREIAEQLLSRYPHQAVLPFFREMCWRNYFQRVWEAKGDEIFSDLKHPQQNVQHHQIPGAIVQAKTGIHAIDTAINEFYETGYLHNHMRMYIAALTCNIGHAHWKQPAQWMYYHLLDGDPASNMLSWQWVAGSFSSKQYIMNQDNVNQYTKSKQVNSFLDVSYEQLYEISLPDCMKATDDFMPKTTLPETQIESDPHAENIFLYDSFQLDPSWHTGESGKRILLLEPKHFEEFPVSEKVLNFILDLSKQIHGIECYCGSFESLRSIFPNTTFHFIDHPTNQHYIGQREKRNLLFPSITGYYGSFSAYWKKAEPLFYKNQF
jgi:deoxyribodipyrimidine photo-lyase